MENKKAGRPPIQLKDLPSDWQDVALTHYSEGGSDIEFYADYLDICHETFTSLISREPLFSETIKKARAKSEAWWVKSGRVNLKDKDFSATLWYMNMKNRFGWCDKNDVNHSGEIKNVKVDLTIEELKQQALTRGLPSAIFEE
jgi:hypothetical protein